MKTPSNGGKSPPSVTLVHISVEGDGVLQKWGVYANGQKVVVRSTTDGKGDTEVSGQDLDLGEGGLTAQQAVAFILQSAHPRYYPKPGRTVVLDKEFVRAALKKFSH